MTNSDIKEILQGIAVGLAILAIAAAIETIAIATATETWRGIEVADSADCKRSYRDYRSVYEWYELDEGLEQRIARHQGGEFSPYDLQRYSLGETDIEHIVSRKEAHESGLCKQGIAAIRSFVTDLGNLTLASAKVNRSEKGSKDAAGWTPERNKCWFAQTVITVKRTWNLTVDLKEKDKLEEIISGCESFTMERPS